MSRGRGVILETPVSISEKGLKSGPFLRPLPVYTVEVQFMNKYRKRPIVIEAIQFDGTKDNLADILRISNSIGIYSSEVLAIKTLEGTMEAHLDDWIIKGIQGELYPCKPDIFEQTYEAVKD